MLTTARKIEIATSVMQDPRLGTFENTTFYGICDLVYILMGKKEDQDFGNCMRGLFVYGQGIGVNMGLYWFPLNGPQARTERIEFLQKYIQHLKEKL
jgi:hypothetical protein